MYLMEGWKLLDVQVFNGQQKLLKLYELIFLWIFENFAFFSHFYTSLELKSIRSFCRKSDSQFDRKKELDAMREFFYVVSMT